jgi:methyl coenzyme M reductase subunit D
MNLEKEKIKEKHESLRMEVIEELVKRYPNDFDLGAKVREFVRIKETTTDDFKL